MRIIEIFDRGGPVVWILFAYSVVAVAIVLERYLHFWRMGRLPNGFTDKLRNASSSGNHSTVVEGLRGPEIAIVKGLLRARQSGVQDLVRVASHIGSQEVQRMERGFRTLGLLGDTAPLLGLFGTILGMIKAFMVIETAGGKVDAQALAGGIWEAMITTGVGLAVALPIFFLLHWLEELAERRAHGMKTCASIITDTSPRDDDFTLSDDVRHRQDPSYGI